MSLRERDAEMERQPRENGRSAAWKLRVSRPIRATVATAGQCFFSGSQLADLHWPIGAIRQVTVVSDTRRNSATSSIPLEIAPSSSDVTHRELRGSSINYLQHRSLASSATSSSHSHPTSLHQHHCRHPGAHRQPSSPLLHLRTRESDANALLVIVV